MPYPVVAADVLTVKSATTTAPPGSPSAGDRYAVPFGSTGLWADDPPDYHFSGGVAEWDGSSWNRTFGWLETTTTGGVTRQRQYPPNDHDGSVLVLAEDDGRYYFSDGAVWTEYPVAPFAYADAKTGTSYTLQPSDCGKVLTFNNAGAITLTVAPDLGAGFNCLVIQKGAGRVTFAEGAGVTVNHPDGHTKTGAQGAVCTLVSDEPDNFYLGGYTGA